jgi:hypothetical protein
LAKKAVNQAVALKNLLEDSGVEMMSKKIELLERSNEFLNQYSLQLENEIMNAREDLLNSSTDNPMLLKLLDQVQSIDQTVSEKNKFLAICEKELDEF